MGYHLDVIEKGKLGEASKIKEEFQEFWDAHHNQHSPILELCELADMVGAIEAYAEKHYNIGLEKVILMMMATKDAFKDGTRK